jgi:Spy/CpxP family protein refolding chaperone
MKNNLIRFAGVAALACGAMFAQTPAAPDNGQPPAHHRQGGRGHGFERLATRLNLTDAQKQQAKSIFDAARETSKPIAQQLRQQRQALQEAAKAGKSDAEIDQLAGDVGSLTSQVTAVRTKAFAKFYAMLTPEQRSQAQEMRQNMRERFQHRRGPGKGEGAGQ